MPVPTPTSSAFISLSGTSPTGFSPSSGTPPLSFKQAHFPNYFAGTLDLLQNKKLFNPALELGNTFKETPPNPIQQGLGPKLSTQSIMDAKHIKLCSQVAEKRAFLELGFSLHNLHLFRLQQANLLDWGKGYSLGNLGTCPLVFMKKMKMGKKEGYNIDKAVQYINDNALSKSGHVCAKHVRMAIEAGGLSTNGRPASATDYDLFLPKLGFTTVVKTNYIAQKGDIVVFKSFGDHVHGHIQMYNGSQWVSDFKQNGFGVWKDGYKEYVIFRWE